MAIGRVWRAPAAAVALMLGTVLAAPHTLADDEAAQRAIDTRQGLLKVVGAYMGPLVGMAREQIPYDAATVEKNASAIAALTPMIPDMFRLDTSGSGLESGSLDDIWENWDDFAAKAATSAERAQAMAAAAGDQGAAMKAFGALGGSCKGCHDEYREQD